MIVFSQAGRAAFLRRQEHYTRSVRPARLRVAASRGNSPALKDFEHASRLLVGWIELQAALERRNGLGHTTRPLIRAREREVRRCERWVERHGLLQGPHTVLGVSEPQVREA